MLSQLEDVLAQHDAKDRVSTSTANSDPADFISPACFQSPSIPAAASDATATSSTMEPIWATPEMLTKLSIWLQSVHDNYGETQDSLMLALELLRLYSKKRRVTKDKFQCVGIVCLFVSLKYLGGRRSRVTLLSAANVCANKYTLGELLHFQQEILLAVDFNLEVAGIYLQYTNKRGHLKEAGNKWDKDEAKILFWCQAWLMNGSMNSDSSQIMEVIEQFVREGKHFQGPMKEMVDFVNLPECGYLRYSYLGSLEDYLTGLFL